MLQIPRLSSACFEETVSEYYLFQCVFDRFCPPITFYSTQQNQPTGKSTMIHLSISKQYIRIDSKTSSRLLYRKTKVI